MPNLLPVLPALLTAAAVVVRQWRGSPLRLKRVLLAPVLLLVLGLFTGAGPGGRATLPALAPADVLLLAAGGAAAVAIGTGQGRTLRLENRAGVLWTRMPVAGLGWWLLLAGLRAAVSCAGRGLGAQVAPSAATVLLFLGANRLGQAAVLLLRVRATGLFAGPDRGRSSPIGAWAASTADPARPRPARSSRPGERADDHGRARRDERRRERSAARSRRRRGGTR